jgi:ABC-type antimicrobial peptide transport system permease subunit
MTLVVRATGDARALVPELQRQINAIDPELAIGSPRTLRQVVESKIATRRLLTWLGNGFTVAALLLAMVGIYATLSYTLLQRRREIGIRIALGAVPSHILRFVLGQTGAWALAGVVGGLVGALVASLLLRSLVYDVSPFDPWSLLGAVVAIALMVVGASVVPALRATRVNPIDALRNE